MAGDGEWIYEDGAAERGPLDLATLGQMRDAGLVTGATRVRPVGGEAWYALDEAIAGNAPTRRGADVAPSEDAPISAGPKLPPVPKYFLMDGGDQPEGPYTVAELAAMARSNRLPAGALVARDGDTDWTPAERIIGPSGPPVPRSAAMSQGGPKGGHGSGSDPTVGAIKDMMSNLSGLPHLEGFRWGMLFRGIFDWGSAREIDERFNAGCRLTTPAIDGVDAGWPTPWAFPRIMAVGIVTTLGLALMYHLFENFMALPGLMIAGSFAVPAACLALFFEMNVLRNVSMTKVSYLVAAGGVLSLLLSLVLYSALPVATTFLGAMAAGIIEEAGKLFAAMMLVGGARRFGWTLNGILLGAAVGAGFAGFETAGYLFGALIDGSTTGQFYAIMFQRALFSPFCHVVWTATVVGALWRVKREGSPWEHIGDRRFWRVLLIVMGLHMLWNSPLHWIDNALAGRISVGAWAVSIVGSWYLVLMLVQEGLNEVRAAQSGAGDGRVPG